MVVEPPTIHLENSKTGTPFLANQKKKNEQSTMKNIEMQELVNFPVGFVDLLYVAFK